MNKFTPEEYFEKREKANRFAQLVEEKRPPNRYLVTWICKRDICEGWKVTEVITLDQARQQKDHLTNGGLYAHDYHIIISEIIDLKD